MKSSIAALFVSLLGLTTVAEASLIRLDSVAGLVTSIPGVTTVTITPHPLWQQAPVTNPGDPTDTSAAWISYKASGYGDAPGLRARG